MLPLPRMIVAMKTEHKGSMSVSTERLFLFRQPLRIKYLGRKAKFPLMCFLLLIKDEGSKDISSSVCFFERVRPHVRARSRGSRTVGERERPERRSCLGRSSTHSSLHECGRPDRLSCGLSSDKRQSEVGLVSTSETPAVLKRSNSLRGSTPVVPARLWSCHYPRASFRDPNQDWNRGMSALTNQDSNAETESASAIQPVGSSNRA